MNKDKFLSHIVWFFAIIIYAPIAFTYVLFKQWKRIAYIMSGYFLVPFLNAWCVINDKDKYPQWAYYWGAYEEDGLDGDRLGWYSKHLGYSFANITKWQRYVITLRWWHRNSCFNLRWHPKLGINVKNLTNIKFRGNTYHHGQRYSFEPQVSDTKWHVLHFEVDGVEHQSYFAYVKLFGDYRLYLRLGLKIYPAYYLDPWWIAKINKEGWPDYKESGVYIGMLRLMDVKQEYR